MQLGSIAVAASSLPLEPSRSTPAESGGVARIESCHGSVSWVSAPAVTSHAGSRVFPQHILGRASVSHRLLEGTKILLVRGSEGVFGREQLMAAPLRKARSARAAQREPRPAFAGGGGPTPASPHLSRTQRDDDACVTARRVCVPTQLVSVAFRAKRRSGSSNTRAYRGGERVRLLLAGCEQRLAWGVRVETEGAARSALELSERRNPATLEEAVALVCPDRRPSSQAFDAIADAWDRHRYTRDMPWD